jgi:hypothetical protein
MKRTKFIKRVAAATKPLKNCAALEYVLRYCPFTETYWRDFDNHVKLYWNVFTEI